MENLLKAVLLGHEKSELYGLLATLQETGRHYFLRNEILKVFSQLCDQLHKPQYFFHSSTLGQLIQFTHEILIDHQDCWLVLRPAIAQQSIYRIDLSTDKFSQMTPAELLNCRDRIVNCENRNTFEINLEPFSNPELTIEDPRNIGQGFNFLHQFLLDKHAQSTQDWEDTLFQIIHQCRYQTHSFLIGSDIYSLAQLKASLPQAYQVLAQYRDDECATRVIQDFRDLGLEPGWGNTIGRCRDTLKLLERVIQYPDANSLEAFLGKIPNVFSLVSVSVHGWVGQENVLGKAETAGQVAYVLDQARSLENKLNETIEQAGLALFGIEPQVILLTRLIPDCEGTQCNIKFEDIQGTRYSKILRVPFRDSSEAIVPQWISKFQVWPYLENFAAEACVELAKLFQGRKPDLIIGHYSDGNLVAYRMAKQLHTLHCSIAHSLEKTRHLFGDLYWQKLEDQYHFSKQFAADLISINASDFILTSSQHEIFGTHDTVGQYESYECFTLPNLFHVINGVNLKSAKFNVVPPGVDETIFFPHSQQTKRVPQDTDRLQSLLFSSPPSDKIGQLSRPTLRPLFTFAPLQSGKNLPGLIEAYGQHDALREQCNLILLTGYNQLHQAENPEQELILKQIHGLIRKYDLERHICWIGRRFSSQDLGEIYRIVADRQGILLHCAHFEAFGLTLLEAMISGLPVFTTKFGGAAEVIVPGKTGFLINPTEMDQALEQVLRFVEHCNTDPLLWQSFSDASIHHVHTHYRWSTHVDKVLTLTKIHKYLKQEDKKRQDALQQYLEALYRLVYQHQSPWAQQFDQSQAHSALSPKTKQTDEMASHPS